ncbi:MAG: hypothetical protein LBE09_02100 [Christensenellaceae bacterium]|jgi:hypothetical protein|nr:hypothetical protein [Christensenellaceae bacterium]
MSKSYDGINEQTKYQSCLYSKVTLGGALKDIVLIFTPASFNSVVSYILQPQII